MRTFKVYGDINSCLQLPNKGNLKNMKRSLQERLYFVVSFLILETCSVTQMCKEGCEGCHQFFKYHWEISKDWFLVFYAADVFLLFHSHTLLTVQATALEIISSSTTTQVSFIGGVFCSPWHRTDYMHWQTQFNHVRFYSLDTGL